MFALHEPLLALRFGELSEADVEGQHLAPGDEAFAEALPLGIISKAQHQALIEEITATVSAFANQNRQGGLLVLGIDSDARGKLLALGNYISSTETLHVIKEDPDDDRILECDAAAKSDFIVSEDKDLLRLEQFGNTRIVSVRDFINVNLAPTLGKTR